MPRQTLTFLTPCFCGGADNKTGPAELRVPSLRGQLRYWTRMLFHVPGKPDAGARKEHELFGGIRAKDLGFKHPIAGLEAPDAVASKFTVRLTFRPPSPVLASQPLCPHDSTKGWRSALPPGAQFDLEWNTALSSSPGTEMDLRRVLKAWLLLGSLGARSTRAAGSVWRVGKPLSEEEFKAAVNSLWSDQKLPDFFKVQVLRRPSQQELETWSQESAAEQLRAIATDLNELRMAHGGTFGYAFKDAEGSHRKTSPLRLKMGQFTEAGKVEHRLIATWDNRDGRGGKLKAAILDQADKKLIGKLLRAAFFP